MKQPGLFILAKYSAKPKDPSKTRHAGYMQDPANVAYNESVVLSAKLKKNDVINHQVVLDLVNQKVTRNSFRSDKSYDELVKYYYDNYPQYFTQALKSLYPGVFTDDNVQPVQTETEETPGS